MSTMVRASGGYSITNMQQSYNNGYNAAKVGTADNADVLAGKTFTNSTSVGISGSMPNRSGDTIAVNQRVSSLPNAGYYNNNTIDATNVYLSGQNVGLDNYGEDAVGSITGKGCHIKKDETEYVGDFINSTSYDAFAIVSIAAARVAGEGYSQPSINAFLDGYSYTHWKTQEYMVTDTSLDTDICQRILTRMYYVPAGSRLSITVGVGNQSGAVGVTMSTIYTSSTPHT